jgi:hypothetical protein
MIPWVEGISEDRIRSSFDSFLASASKAYDAVLLDLVPFARSDIANEAALKSDVVVVTARQNVALFSETRNIVESSASGGVPAVTTLLNFCRPDPLRLRALALLATAQASASMLHVGFTARACEAGSSLLKKILASKSGAKISGRPPEAKPAEPAPAPGVKPDQKP